MVAPIGLWLSCPRCGHDVDARNVFRKAELSRLRPGIVTCPHCGAKFTYGLKGFRVFAIAGLIAVLMCGWLAALQILFGDTYYEFVVGAAMLPALVSVGGLMFAGRQRID